MEKRNFIIPEFGPLAGLRVIGAGSLIAMPFAATMMADFGAEVIQIERPKIGDTYRSFPPLKKTEQGTAGSSWMQDARNRLSMTLELDLNDPDVKEIVFRLIERSDIFIENMVWLDKLGIHDSELLKINPRLVIVHVSGYGHKEFGGLPEICNQASYDIGLCSVQRLSRQSAADRKTVARRLYNGDVCPLRHACGAYKCEEHRPWAGR